MSQLPFSHSSFFFSLVTSVLLIRLNRLQVERVQYPESPDVRPMISECFNYDARLEPAMQHVFGKKLLAKTADSASTWSARCDMDAITLDGDLCSRKGALTGGFVDANKSRIRTFTELGRAEERKKQLEREHGEMQQKATGVDNKISSLMGEIQRLQAKKANLEHVTQRTEDDISSLQNRVDSKKKQREQIENNSIPPIEMEIKSLESQVERLIEEMGTELSANLSDVERKTLVVLKANQARLDEKIEEQSQALEEVSIERQRLESLLEDNLRKRKTELEQENTGEIQSRRRRRGITDNTADVQARRKNDLEQRRRELDEASMVAEDQDTKLDGERKTVSRLQRELITAKSEFEKLKAKADEINQELAEAQENSERVLNRRTMCISKRELYMRKIQELGSLPPQSELQQYTSSSISALMRRLEEVNKKLKQYSHVNKKAYDQFVNFSEQRENLLQRKAELDKGEESIKEMIESLDRKKDEAINRTFRGVSAHFKEVFKELCPNGSGELIMKTAMDEDSGQGDADESNDELSDEESNVDKKKGENVATNPKVSLYRGVGIKVRFAKEEQNYLMSQLSGGQKALVALGLIFAIQRCDPAPFYLFDELDQALDSTHRAAVAGLVQRQANSDENPTQFICSTFRPELVNVANRCYGISHQNKVSNIHFLSKKAALHFIANLMSEDDALGEVTSVAPSKASRSLTGAGRKRKVIDASGAATKEGVAEKENEAENEADIAS